MTAPPRSPLYVDSTQEVPERAEAERRFLVAAEKIRPLYVLSDVFNQLITLIEDPIADQAALDAEMVAVTRDIQAKAFGIAEIIRDRERYAADLKLEEDRLATKRKTALNLAERLKDYALQEMHVLGIDRIDTGVHTLSVRQNNPAVQILNEPVLARVEAYETMPDVPPQFVTLITLWKVNRRAILAHVKTTGEIPEGTDVTRGESLRIS